MPDSTINHTPAGWPYLDAQNYWDTIPPYTAELAQKLQNSDADVAAAINAANIVQQLVGSWPQTSVQVGAGFTTPTSWDLRVQRTGGTVLLNGLLTPPSSLPTSQTTIATLPTWAHPDRSIRFTTHASTNGAIGALEINPSGVLSYHPVWWPTDPQGWLHISQTWVKHQPS